MKLTGSKKITACSAVAGLTVLAVSLITGTIGASAQSGRNGQVHIVKDCTYPTFFSGNPGSSYCQIVKSNLPELLPAGTKIYYNQITGTPTAGVAGFFDTNVFVYINERQWAVGRCTGPKDGNPGLCTLSDGVGPLARFSARIVVTYSGGALFAWDGTYSFKSLPER